MLFYMRAPMLLLFGIIVWATYILGARLYSKRVGVWSALLLSLFPVFFLKSLEYRTDNLWTVFWCLALLILTGGDITAPRVFAAGLLLGCALTTSMKTSLLILTLIASFKTDGVDMLRLPVGWIILYGCALHAAGFFMPRGMKIFGWAFVLGGCALAIFDWPGPLYVYAHGMMGFFFGALHLAYGVYLYFTERGKNAA